MEGGSRSRAADEGDDDKDAGDRNSNTVTVT